MFVDIFSGTTTTKKIVWIRGIRELHYLIDKLEELELVSWTQKYGKWQMVCARFDIRVKVKEDDDDSMTNDSFVTDSLKPQPIQQGRWCAGQSRRARQNHQNIHPQI